LPKAWIQDRKRDYYYQKAKQEKYRSRSSYKLSQAIEKYHFIKYGDVVIDLGAAPGGWVQIAKRIVGNKGFVLGVDLRPFEPFPQSYVRTVIGDITDEVTVQQILEMIPRKANAVISDVSPNISGVWEVDHARQIDLAEQALRIALQTLEVGGNFFAKIFQGDLLDGFVKKVQEYFETVMVIKPKASRAQSSEMFVLGMRLMQGASRGQS
jgi:23S rRNA (uridine2552-2'-O)-methyltransferase